MTYLTLSTFNTIAQQAATERRDIEEDYLTGSNALVSQYGGPQATQLQRIKEMALNKSRERQGMRNVEVLSDLRRQAADQLQRASDTHYDQLTRKYGLIGQLMNSSSYDARRRGGIFNPDTIAGLAQSFVGGLGAAAG